MNTLVKNQEILLTIKRIGINGEGIGYYKKLAVFVKGALPGEECVVKITKVMDKYSEAELVRIKSEPSMHRVEPKCPHYNKCFHYELCFDLKFPPDDAWLSHCVCSPMFPIFQ